MAIDVAAVVLFVVNASVERVFKAQLQERVDSANAMVRHLALQKGPAAIVDDNAVEIRLREGSNPGDRLRPRAELGIGRSADCHDAHQSHRGRERPPLWLRRYRNPRR